MEFYKHVKFNTISELVAWLNEHGDNIDICPISLPDNYDYFHLVYRNKDTDASEVISSFEQKLDNLILNTPSGSLRDLLCNLNLVIKDYQLNINNGKEAS